LFVNANGYIEQVLCPFIPKLPRPKRLVFMQDSATCHTATPTAQSRNIEVLPDWLANSPDLNPIEDVWAYVEKR